MAIFIDCSLPGPEKGLDDFLVAQGKEALIEHISKCSKAYIVEYKEQKKDLIEAIKYLSGDVIRDNFLSRLKKVGLVGEEKTAVICYVGSCSRLSHKINGALHILIIGPSGGGKSSVAEHVCIHFIGEDNFKERASFTIAALYRSKENAIKYKTILISEVVHLDQEQEDISALFRTLKTSGKAEREVTIQVKGDFVTITLKIEGPTNIIGTTTSFKGKDEDLNRDFICTLDDSTDQTDKIRKVKNEKLKKYNPFSENWIQENKKIQLLVQETLYNFIPVFTEIPYIDRINYPNREERARRDGDKIDKALESICHIYMLNRKFKLAGAKAIVDEIKKFIEEYDFYTSELTNVVLIQNQLLSLYSQENRIIENQNNNTSEILESEKSIHCEAEIVIGISGEDIVIDGPDPFLNYGILKEFVLKKGYKFILISDERDFSILEEYFGPSIESSYNGMGQNLMKYYRKLLEEGDRTNDYDFTATRFSKLVNQSDTWTRKILYQLVGKDFAELQNPRQKPLKFKVIKNKLSNSFNQEANSKDYRLCLKEPGDSSSTSCFDYEHCRINRPILNKSDNKTKTTRDNSEVTNTDLRNEELLDIALDEWVKEQESNDFN